MVRTALMSIVIFCLIAGVMSYVVFKYWPAIFGTNKLWDGYTVQKRTVGGREARLIVADNAKRWSQGLMFVEKSGADFDGMIFIFPTAAARMFWNMNTYADLKIYWMKGGKVIGTADLPSIRKSKTIVTRSSPGPADTVIEIIQ